MNNIIFLSYFMNPNTPAFGGGNAVNINVDRSISKGDSCNTSIFSFSNHTGTHIDFPYHFNNDGKTLNDYSPDFWIFNSSFLISYPCKGDEVIFFEKEIEDIPLEIEFLMIKTGFGKFRDTDKYWNNNPGLHSDMAKILKQKFKNLKSIGFDFISISSFHNREMGRKAHKEFLVENEILIIEDMDLSQIDKNPAKVICLPLLVDHCNGTPVTVLGIL
jgi:arylformamidase